MTKEATNTYFVYEEEAFLEVDDALQSEIKNLFTKIILFEEGVFDQFNENEKVALFLPDSKIEAAILKANEKGFALGFLPHPKADELINSYSVDGELNTAINDFFEIDKLVESDLLFCNNQLVNNYLLIGDIITNITQKNRKKNVFFKIRNFFNFVKKLNKIRPKSLHLKADEKDIFHTAAAGILVTQHAKNALVSRLILEQSYLNDGLFHCLVFAPRSFTKIIFSYVKMLINFRQKKGTSHLHFLGHIKTNDLHIKYDNEESCTIDGRMIKAKEFYVKIDGYFKLVPSKSLLFTKEQKGNKKVFKIAQLPNGEDVIKMLSKRLPFIEHATTSEFKELFTTLRENANTNSSYIILMILSTVLATFGLFANSTPIIIGAMILAPLISPVISLSMGTLRQDKNLIKSSLITIFWGLFFSYLAAILLTLITPLNTLNHEISSRIKPNLLDLGVAVVSGIAGAYAHANTNVAKTLAGVAIAVALVPPLAVSGIGIGWGNWNIFIGALTLLLANLTGMVLSGAFTFLLMGFSPFKIAKKGLLISLVIVLAISVPLSYGFYQVVKQNNIEKIVNGIEVEDLVVKNVSVINKEPLKISFNLICNRMPINKDLDEVKKKIEDKLGQKVSLEINFKFRK